MVLAAAALFAFVLLFAIDFFAPAKNPYVGILAYVVAPFFSRDGSAYCYVYVRLLSQAYVARGLK